MKKALNVILIVAAAGMVNRYLIRTVWPRTTTTTG